MRFRKISSENFASKNYKTRAHYANVRGSEFVKKLSREYIGNGAIYVQIDEA